MADISVLLGFAAKAGRISCGYSAAKSALSAGKAKVVLVASDVSQKSQKEISFFAEKSKIPVLVLRTFDMQSLSDAVGRKCGILSVNDSSFAGAITAAVEGGNANEQ